MRKLVEDSDTPFLYHRLDSDIQSHTAAFTQPTIHDMLAMNHDTSAGTTSLKRREGPSKFEATGGFKATFRSTSMHKSGLLALTYPFFLLTETTACIGRGGSRDDVAKVGIRVDVIFISGRFVLPCRAKTGFLGQNVQEKGQKGK